MLSTSFVINNRVQIKKITIDFIVLRLIGLKMIGLTLMWFLIWIYLSRNFEQILEALGMKHTPRKIQAEVDPLRKWKFTNTRTSLIHSIFTGWFHKCSTPWFLD